MTNRYIMFPLALLPLVPKVVVFFFVFWAFFISPLHAADLEEVKRRGVLRHLGVNYAQFVREDGTGLDVELMRRFADHLGVAYELVPTTWQRALGDLTGRHVKAEGREVVFLEETEVRGDVLANGLTVLPWREEVVDFSIPVFPTGVWLMARADSRLRPISPSGRKDIDILATKKQLAGHTVLVMEGTCLDADLYDLAASGAIITRLDKSKSIDDLAPAILNGKAEATLLDIPTALLALQKWAGALKVIGPISPPQMMGVAFPKSAPHLREAFNMFFDRCLGDGTYTFLVQQYYPSVFLYLNDFFSGGGKVPAGKQKGVP